jgi:predicted Fe-Mo cluster-binding NifX family protein
MNLCIPVMNDLGLESPVCEHFGSAPFFLLVDTATRACRTIENRNQHHAHGMCQPLAALAGEAIDGMVVGGIGMGALNKLGAAGVQVFFAQHPTVGETVDAFLAGTLKPVDPRNACAHHGQGHEH